MNVIINKHLFAAYCGMLKSGYDLMDFSDEVVSTVHAWVTNANFSSEISYYFQFTKTNTVPVNPYYPRGSDLSAACFFQDTSIDKYIDFLHTCGSSSASNPSFIEWISSLPHILAQIEAHDGFTAIYRYYCECLRRRFADISDQISAIERTLKSKPFNSQTSLIFAPNLLQSKFLADYVLFEDMLYVISGTFSSSAVIHEYLHIALNPLHTLLVDVVREYGLDKYADVNRMSELGYLQGNTVEDKAHVLDECLVRAICGAIDKSLNLSDYCHNNKESGFISVPQMIDKLSMHSWCDMTLREIIFHTLNIN